MTNTFKQDMYVLMKFNWLVKAPKDKFFPIEVVEILRKPWFRWMIKVVKGLMWMTKTINECTSFNIT